MIHPEFWRSRRVFLTGHTGFKGSWLALWLQQLGANVTGYALAPATNPSLFNIANVSAGMTSVLGDIRDATRLQQTLQKAQPEVVLHLAAQPIVRLSYSDPVETYSTNVMGLVNLFEAIRAVGGVRACVNVTSDKCYENHEWVYGYRESDAMGGYDPYSSSKGCAELVTAAYRRSFFSGEDPSKAVALASARAGNVIGGGDWAPDRLIPDIMRAVAARTPVEIRHPGAVRPWQHVLEPLSGYLMLAERLMGESGAGYAQGWNFGPAPSDTRPVAWIADYVTRLWGGGASWRHIDTSDGLHEAHSLSLDCLKAHRELNWRPAWNIDAALEKIVDWHRSHLAGADMKECSLQQIAQYCSSLAAREA